VLFYHLLFTRKWFVVENMWRGGEDNQKTENETETENRDRKSHCIAPVLSASTAQHAAEHQTRRWDRVYQSVWQCCQTTVYT